MLGQHPTLLEFPLVHKVGELQPSRGHFFKDRLRSGIRRVFGHRFAIGRTLSIPI
jgi:hypothetical protein